MAAMVLAAALWPGCGIFSHKLAQPPVHHAQGQWTHENATIYDSVSLLPQGNYLIGYEHKAAHAQAGGV